MITSKHFSNFFSIIFPTVPTALPMTVVVAVASQGPEGSVGGRLGVIIIVMASALTSFGGS